MKFEQAISELFRSIIDFLFPPACPVCGGSLTDNDVICQQCIYTISNYSYTYSVSKRKIENIDNISILLPYNSVCRSIIHDLKYHGMHSIGLVLGRLLAKKALKENSFRENACLVPVPLHNSRFQERGYNQSERIAKGFSEFSGLEICNDLIERIKETGSQTALDQKQRIFNVRDVFKYSGNKFLSGREVILFDDVMTTGSTVSECGKVLKESGAGKITVCVVATPQIGMD